MNRSSSGIKKKVNTENIRTISKTNTLPVGWGIRKIHIKIYFKWQIILEKSLFPKDEYFAETDQRINFLMIEHWTKVRTDWLLNDDGFLDGGSDWFRGIWAKSGMKELTIQIDPSYSLELLKLKTFHTD